MQRPTNVTNSNDPGLVRCRVFVGNLNTKGLGKEDIDFIFFRYGPVSGISVHKGYAFVQYQNEMDARRCCSAEDGAIYANQRIDVNMVSEPKSKNSKAVAPKSPAAYLPPPQPLFPGIHNNQKRSMPVAGPGPRGPTAPKQFRQDAPRNLVNLAGPTKIAPNKPKPILKPSMVKTSASSTKNAPSDILICGTCRTQFMSLDLLTKHKDEKCQVPTCRKCQLGKVQPSPEPNEIECATCDKLFTSAWDLCKHCQEEHEMYLYKNEEDIVQTESTESVENGTTSS